jgi:hypothetical protein
MTRPGHTQVGKEESWFESQLRASAPTFQPRREHQHQLKTVLISSQRQRRRVWPPVLLGLTSVVGILVLCSRPLDLGGYGFKLSPRSSAETGQVFESTGGDHAAIGVDSRTEVDPQEAQLLAENIWQRSQAREGLLRAVTGWTLAGETVMMTEYAYDIDGQVRLAIQCSAQPATHVTDDYLSFTSSRDLARAMRMIHLGQARQIGAENQFVDGYPVRFVKWSLVMPPYGTLIYWQGVPLYRPGL